MKKSTCLSTLVCLAELKEKQAIKSLVEIRNHKTIEEEKLDHLLGYRDQYLENFGEAEQAGISVSRMLETRTFLDKLDKAIQEQEDRIRLVDGRIESRSLEWREFRHQRLNFEELMREDRHKQDRVQEKREQHEMDERSGSKRNSYHGA
ncbi:MAG: flagellar export protein FliJ [Gammaproteobacteria bacterium]